MGDSDQTPLQRLLRDAIARSGKARDYSDRLLQEKLGTKGKPLYDISRGKSLSPSLAVVNAIADVLPVTREEIHAAISGAAPAQEAGHRGDRSEQPLLRSADAGETAPITRLDLSYAMGPGTNLDDAHVEGEAVELDIAFLRRLTPSPPEALRIVSGVGDSMHPTIHDREELIIDTAQTRLNMQDRIWAIALFEAGALKRLRTISRDRVLVISDNPDVPDQEVDAGDIAIVGRLVGSIRRH